MLFEVTQSGGEHVGGDSHDVAGQFTVPTRSAKQRPDHEQRPAITNLIEGQSEGGVVHRFILPESRRR